MMEIVNNNQQNDSNDLLWKQVMDNVILKHPHVKHHWKEVSHNEKLCSCCSELGGGALIKCSHDKCNKEFHLDCAYNTNGGFYLDYDGNLEFECQHHFKPTTFCSCRKGYDENISYIGCDTCVEWFHYGCVGLTVKEANKLNNYTCSRCQATLNEGKQVSKTLIEKNTIKEERSVHNLSATKSLRVLVEISLVICPIIDSLNPSSTSLSEVDEAIVTLSSSQFADIFTDKNKESDDEKEDEDGDDKLERFGTGALICDWRDKLVAFKNNMENWIERSNDVAAEVRDSIISISLDSNQVEIITNAVIRLLPLEEELKGLSINNEDIEGFCLFMDSLRWIMHFLSLLHQVDRNEQLWFQQLNSQIRNSSQIMRRLVTLSEDTYCRPFVVIFQEYIQLAVKTTESMADWFDRLSLLLSNGDSNDEDKDKKCSSSLTIMLEEVQSYPVAPPGIQILKELIISIDTLEIEVDKALKISNKKRISFEEYEILQTRRNELTIIDIPSSAKLDFVGYRYECMQDYNDVFNNSPRIPIEILLEFKERLSKWPLNTKISDENAIVPDNVSIYVTKLSKELDKEVNQLVENINDIYLNASPFIDVAKKMLKKSCSNNLTELTTEEDDNTSDKYTSILESLQSTKIISIEERMLEYYYKSEEIINKTNALLKVINTTPITFDELHDIQSEITKLLNDEYLSIYSEYILTKQTTSILYQLNEKLYDIKKSSKSLWSYVDESISICKSIQSNRIVILEEFNEILIKANNSNIYDNEILIQAKLLQDEAKVVTTTCIDNLLLIIDPIKDFPLAEMILCKSNSVPLPAGLADKVRKRYTVCKTVTLCQHYIDSDVSNRDSKMDICDGSNASSSANQKLEIIAIRDLRTNIINLISDSAIGSIELDMINTIKDTFLLIHFKKEVKYTLAFHLSLTIALDIKSIGMEVGNNVEDTDEWQSLSSEIASITEKIEEGDKIIEIVNQIKLETNNILKNKVDITILSQSMNLWNGKLKDVKIQIELLISQLETQQLSDENLSNSLNKTLTLINMIAEASVMIEAINSKLLSSSNNSSNNSNINEIDVSIDSSFTITPLVDVRDLTSLANNFRQLSDNNASNISSNCVLITEIAKTLFSFHSEATKWNEQVLALLPLRSTRKKIRIENQSIKVEFLKDLLNQPIAYAVNLPMREVIISTLNELVEVRNQLKNILFDTNNLKIERKDLQFVLNDYGNIINDLKIKMELIPVYVVDLHVVNWLEQIIVWWKELLLYNDNALIVEPIKSYIIDTNNEGYNANAEKISIEEAQTQLLASSRLIPSIPLPVSEILHYLASFNTKKEFSDSINYSTKLFNNNILSILRFSTDIHNNLEAKINKTIDFQNKLNQFKLEEYCNDYQLVNEKINIKLLRELDTELDDLDIQPEKDVFKLIEYSLSRCLSKENKDKSNDKVKLTHRAGNKFTNRDTDIQIDSLQNMKNISSTSTSSSSSSNSINEKSAKKRKSTGPCCCAIDCQEEINSSNFDSTDYCSDICSLKASSDVINSLLLFRSNLCIIAITKDSVITTTNNKNINLTSLIGDRTNFSHHLINVTNSVNKMNTIISNYGFKTQNQDINCSNTFIKTDSNDKDLNSIISNDYNIDSKQLNKKLQSKYSDFLSESIPFSKDVMVRSTSTSIANKQEQSVDIRSVVRTNLEEILLSSLHRQSFPGYQGLAAVVALELEEELYKKYVVVKDKDSKDSKANNELILNKKDYGKHHLLLFRNLQKVHNDELILRIVKSETTIDYLLNMTSHQLADTSVQLKRAEQKDSALRDSQVNESMSEALEKRRRDAMSGAEAWRDGLTTVKDTKDRESKISSKVNSKDNKELDDIEMSTDNIVDIDKVREESVVPIIPLATNPPVLTKRPLNVDSVTRMTSSSAKPVKIAKIDTSSDEAQYPVRGGISPSSSPGSNNSSPRILKSVTNVLDLLKSNSVLSPPSKLDHDSDSDDDVIQLGKYKTLSSVGSSEFSIQRPNCGDMICTGSLNDRRVQGLLDVQFNIDGRTRIGELERFLNEVIARGKKIVSIVYLSFNNSDIASKNTYDTFCSEFTHNEKSGMCNINDRVQLHLVPPSLKNRITFLNQSSHRFNDGSDSDSDDDDDVSRGYNKVLYGIIVSKEVGPYIYVNADENDIESFFSESNPNYVHISSPPTSPAIVSSFNIPSFPVNLAPAPVLPLIPPVAVKNSVVSIPLSMQIAASNSHANVSSSASSTTTTTSSYVFKPPPSHISGKSAISSMGMMGGEAPPPPAPIVADTLKNINKVAMFCATNGAGVINVLKNKPEAMNMMPFLFEGQPGHNEFLTCLRNLVNK